MTDDELRAFLENPLVRDSKLGEGILRLLKENAELREQVQEQSAWLPDAWKES